MAGVMQLQLFKTLWGFDGSLQQAVEQLIAAQMQGLEGPAPATAGERAELKRLLQHNGLAYIAEITTAGSYVPERQASLQQHLASLEEKLQHSAELEPLFVSCLGGCDAWPENQSVEFFRRAMERAAEYGLIISFETHRSRSFFNPWVTERIVAQLPDIFLTVDFSHWCVVCERLMDTELQVIHAIADRVQHIHARVGYDQGPQVPWEIIWRSQLKRNFKLTSMTPEFGPDGYLHEAPFSREPVADLWQLNCWMADEERRHFAAFLAAL